MAADFGLVGRTEFPFLLGVGAKVYRPDCVWFDGKEEVGAVAACLPLSGNLCWRNGLCYALTRRCLMEEAAIFTDRTVALWVTRPVANVDDDLDLAWAEFLMGRSRM